MAVRRYAARRRSRGIAGYVCLPRARKGAPEVRHGATSRYQAVGIRQCNVDYEAEFLGFSYGFRPGRSQHDALDALAYGIKTRNICWILDSDIQAFFDRLSRQWLIRFVEHRVGDRRVIRLIQKWLKAGVLEEDQWTETEGVSQGSVASPLLVNVFLLKLRHHLLGHRTQHRPILPLRIGHQVMHRLVRRAHILRMHSRGHRLDALSFPAQHQAFQIPLRRLAPIGMRQRLHDRLAVLLKPHLNRRSEALQTLAGWIEVLTPVTAASIPRD